MVIFNFVAGLVFLVVGAEALVRGASRLASAMGVSSLIIGLTVVAFGTSAPELAVSVKAALAGQEGIGVGNVVGSNIFNVLFILGLSALVVPLVVSQQLVRLDVPLMIGLSVLVWLFALDGTLSNYEGIFLFTGLIAYVVFLGYLSKRESAAVKAEYESEFGDETHTNRYVVNSLMLLGGFGLLVLGSRWMVDSAVVFAEQLGVSELIIGLTIVAAGTSLPELVTSIVAALRGERDIAVGNVVGSNIFNIMSVLGISSIVSPNGLAMSPAVIHFDIPIMIVVAFACLPIFVTGIIARWQGAVLFLYFLAYLLYLVLAATHHETLTMFSDTMLYFLIPLTLITIVALSIRKKRRNAKEAAA